MVLVFRTSTITLVVAASLSFVVVGSPFFTVDPRHVVRVLNRYGNVLLPQPLEQDLEVLSKVCGCESSTVDVVRREMVSRNLTLSTTEGTTALRVGALRITWDSYRRPSVNIELEDADVSVEFTNLLLTRNNWHELSEVGFPPTMYMTSSPSTKNDGDSFLRISGVTLKGAVRLFVRSRPLGKSILLDDDEHVILNSEDLSGLTDRIRTEISSSPGGLTTSELSDLLVEWFADRARRSVASWALSTATNGNAVRDALEKARDRIASYAGAAVDEGVLGRRGLGLSQEGVAMLKRAGRAAYAEGTAADGGGWKAALLGGIRTASEEAASVLRTKGAVDDATTDNVNGRQDQAEGET